MLVSLHNRDTYCKLGVIASLFLFTMILQLLFQVWVSLDWMRLLLSTFLLLLFYLAKASGVHPRIPLFIKLLMFAALLLASMESCLRLLPLTPFPFIDKALAAFDQSIGFNSEQFWQAIRTLPALYHFFGITYASLNINLFLVMLLGAFLGKQATLEKAVMIFALANLFGPIIYIFWPAIGPMAIYKNIHYSTLELTVLHEVISIHTHQPLKVFIGADISFPSYHVIWAVLMVYAMKDRKWLFILQGIWSLLLILSTLVLAWHYLADDLLGIAIAILCIVFVEKVYWPWIERSGSSPVLSNNKS